MLENFFLTYANYSFREKPDNLWLIHQEIEDSEIGPPMHSVARKFIFENVIEFREDKDVKIAKLNKQKKIEEQIKIGGYDELEFKEYINVAFEAVYDFRNYGCERCFYQDIKEVLEMNNLSPYTKPYCLECNQLRFIGLLSSLVSGQYNILVSSYISTSNINSVGGYELTPIQEVNSRYFQELISLASVCFKVNVYIDETGKLKKSSYIWNSFLTDPSLPLYYRGDRFHTFINSLLGFSLSEFIINNDLRLLKRCKNCDLFYVAKRMTSKYCSVKCKSAWHNSKHEPGENANFKQARKAMGKATASYY